MQLPVALPVLEGLNAALLGPFLARLIFQLGQTFHHFFPPLPERAPQRPQSVGLALPPAHAPLNLLQSHGEAHCLPPAGCLHQGVARVPGTRPLGLAMQAQVRLAQLAVQTDGLGLQLGDIRRRHADPAVQLLGFGAVPAPSALRCLVQATHNLSDCEVLLQESPELGQGLFTEKQEALALVKRL